MATKTPAAYRIAMISDVAARVSNERGEYRTELSPLRCSCESFRFRSGLVGGTCKHHRILASYLEATTDTAPQATNGQRGAAPVRG